MEKWEILEKILDPIFGILSAIVQAVCTVMLVRIYRRQNKILNNQLEIEKVTLIFNQVPDILQKSHDAITNIDNILNNAEQLCLFNYEQFKNEHKEISKKLTSNLNDYFGFYLPHLKMIVTPKIYEQFQLFYHHAQEKQTQLFDNIAKIISTTKNILEEGGEQENTNVDNYICKRCEKLKEKINYIKKNLNELEANSEIDYTDNNELREKPSQLANEEENMEILNTYRWTRNQYNAQFQTMLGIFDTNTLLKNILNKVRKSAQE